MVSTINWMTSSRYLIICVICNKCIIHSYSHPSWHGKDCSSIWKGYQWKTITSSNAPMKLRFRNGKCISCLAQLCFHHQGIVTLSATSISSTIAKIPNINSTNAYMEARVSMEVGVLIAQPPKVVVLIILLMDRVPCEHPTLW